jgi:FAD/FMN-containing dehydrogenase
MDRHRLAVQKISQTVSSFFARREPYRVHKGSTNSTRPRPAGSNTVDISPLRNVLSVDRDRRVALVEPNVAMDALVEATLPHGLVPPVVMEFPGITAGGGFAGTAGESSSFRHGYFDEGVERVEMVLADGSVVDVRPEGERADLFRGAAGAVGTLGLTTLLEVKLMEARKFVRATYRRTSSVAEAVRVVEEEVGKEGNDYVDGILYSKDHGVVISGQLTDEKPEGVKPQTFSGAWDPWFYLHVEEKTRAARDGTVEEYIPLAEYLFRYDRGGFWVGKAAFDYFAFTPFNRLTRWFLDDFLHTRMLYRALHGSGESARMIVQDLAMPFATTEKFVDYTAQELDIWPLWLCPLKKRGPPTFHPFTTLPGGVRSEIDEHMMLNVGLWGWGPSNPQAFMKANRAVEAKVRELGGMKWLYAHTYYPEQEFWEMYGGRQWYDQLREKYNATGLPSVWNKVHVDKKALLRKKRSIWPVGGAVGLWKSIQSKDYMIHRNATWKWKGE